MSEKSQQADLDTGHDYDGIREFDNPLPRWWLVTLYGAMGFAVFYWLYYHTLEAGPLPLAEYEAELQQANVEEAEREAKLEAAGKGVNDGLLLAMAQSPETVQRGQALFKQNCLQCHGDRGQGLVGPNLTDSYWLHGSKATDIYKVISSGILDKGMPAWRTLLGPSKVKDAAAFILTLRNTNVPGKPPQGVTDSGILAP